MSLNRWMVKKKTVFSHNCYRYYYWKPHESLTIQRQFLLPPWWTSHQHPTNTNTLHTPPAVFYPLHPAQWFSKGSCSFQKSISQFPGVRVLRKAVWFENSQSDSPSPHYLENPWTLYANGVIAHILFCKLLFKFCIITPNGCAVYIFCCGGGGARILKLIPCWYYLDFFPFEYTKLWSEHLCIYS